MRGGGEQTLPDHRDPDVLGLDAPPGPPQVLPAQGEGSQAKLIAQLHSSSSRGERLRRGWRTGGSPRGFSHWQHCLFSIRTDMKLLALLLIPCPGIGASYTLHTDGYHSTTMAGVPVTSCGHMPTRPSASQSKRGILPAGPNRTPPTQTAELRCPQHRVDAFTFLAIPPMHSIL